MAAHDWSLRGRGRRLTPRAFRFELAHLPCPFASPFRRTERSPVRRMVRTASCTHISTQRVLTQGVKQMLSRVFPFLKRPDVEFTLECASFILFCAAFLHWVAQI